MSAQAYDLDAIRERMTEAEAARLARSRAGAERRRNGRRRSPPRSTLDGRRRALMRRLVEEVYASEHAPPPGSLRDRRLRAELSLRQLAALALVGRMTVARAEAAAEAGSREGVSGPTWRSLAYALELATGRRVHVDDIRPPAREVETDG